MIIRHERPDPAFSYRVQAPLLLQVGPDAFVELRDWSPEGFEAPPGWPEAPVAGTLTIPFQGLFLSFNVDLPGASPGDFVPFSGLNGRAQEALAHFHGAIVGGRMTSIDGVIQSIDRPVDLVPMTQTEEDGGAVPKRPRRRWGKTAMTVALYGAAAVALWMGLWSGAWERLNTLPLQSGRYEAYDAEAGLASGSGWIDHRHAIEVYVGMEATMSVNVEGEIRDLPAVVIDIHADREPEGRAKSGYVVHVLADTSAEGPLEALDPLPAQLGGPADILLHAPVFPSLARLLNMDDVPLIGAPGGVPALVLSYED